MAAAPENQATSNSVSVDRRAHPRFPFTGAAVFHHPDGTPVPVNFHDISLGGASFTAAKSLKIGQIGILEVAVAGAATAPKRLEVVILWAVLNERTKRCRVGCKWAAPLTDADLARFV